MKAGIAEASRVQGAAGAAGAAKASMVQDMAAPSTMATVVPAAVQVHSVTTFGSESLVPSAALCCSDIPSDFSDNSSGSESDMSSLDIGTDDEELRAVALEVQDFDEAVAAAEEAARLRNLLPV